MSQLKYKEQNHSITVLKSHDLLHIFGYLNYQDLLQCRMVCPDWYHLIKHDSRLMDKFRYSLKFNSGSLVSTEEPPFSVMHKSKIKLKSITVEEDFLEPGNSIIVVDANRSKMCALSTILKDLNAVETVTEMIVHARDNEPRTNALLLQLITEMNKLNVLRFTLTAFVHSLETMCLTQQCKSVESVQILHEVGNRLIIADFERLFRLFPNIKRIDVRPSEAMLLDEHIYQTFAPFIKTIEKLESYTLIELFDIRNMSLSHISYECCGDDIADVASIHEFLTAHREIETMSLKLLNATSEFFEHPLDQLTDLDMVIQKSPLSTRMENNWKLINMLKWTLNLEKLVVKFKGNMEHQFGHQVIKMHNLIDVTLTRFNLDCDVCCATMLSSMVNVKSLTLTPRQSDVSVDHLNAIATNLEQLECLKLIYADSVELQNHFARWPAMPKLKVLVVNRVGFLTNKGISNLSTKCPMLEVIKLYSLRGSKINSLLKFTIECFPNIKAITFRGGRCVDISQLNYINGKVGWRLKDLDISAYIQPPVIIKLFQSNDLLETIRCKYGALVVTRRIYYEVEILKAYTLESIEQPLKSRKRLHLDDDPSSDSETSDSEESTSGPSDESDSEED